jgi:hypothetical protein
MIDPEQEYETRNGLPVKILHVEGLISSHPVVGMITYTSGIQSKISWTIDGYFYGDEDPHPFDLVPKRNSS